MLKPPALQTSLASTHKYHCFNKKSSKNSEKNFQQSNSLQIVKHYKIYT